MGTMSRIGRRKLMPVEAAAERMRRALVVRLRPRQSLHRVGGLAADVKGATVRSAKSAGVRCSVLLSLRCCARTASARGPRKRARGPGGPRLAAGEARSSNESEQRSAAGMIDVPNGPSAVLLAAADPSWFPPRIWLRRENPGATIQPDATFDSSLFGAARDILR